MATMGMSDSEEYYARMRERASLLCERIDEATHALIGVEQAVSEAARSDLEVAGHLGVIEHHDLIYCVDTAKFSVRVAELIALEHREGVRRGASGEVTHL
jgi:hypothetical protein